MNVHMVDKLPSSFLSRLGLTAEECQIYLALMEKGTTTAQNLSLETAIPKTTIYRRLANLEKNALVEEIVEENTTLYRAAPPELLNLLVTKKEEEAKTLRQELPEITQALLGSYGNTDSGTRVLFYRGQEGIEQMAWNTLRCKEKTLRGYSYRTFEEIVGRKFAEKFRDEFAFTGIKARDLYSAEYLKSLNEVGQHNQDWPNWQSRYISPKILDVQHQMDTYDDVLSIYHWHNDEVFGVEIYNQAVANMQKQIFEVLWKMARDG